MRRGLAKENDFKSSLKCPNSTSGCRIEAGRLFQINAIQRILSLLRLSQCNRPQNSAFWKELVIVEPPNCRG